MIARLYHLSSGVPVAIDEVPHSGTVSVGFYFKVGTRHETRKNSGAAHFLEHVAFTGTKTRSERQIDEEAESMGARMNAGTGKGQTLYYMTGQARDSSSFITLLGDILCHSALPSGKIRKERGTILEELISTHYDPDERILAISQAAAYPDNPLGAPVMGSRGNVETMERGTLLAFKNKHYHTGNLIVSVAGNVKAARILRDLETALEDMPCGPESVFRKAEYRGDSLHAARVGEQMHLILQFNGCAYNDSLHTAQEVLGNVLTSDLFNDIRTERGLVYSVEAFSDAEIDSGLFRVYMASRREGMEKSVPLVREANKRACEERFDGQKLKRAKAVAKTDMIVAADKMEMRMTMAAYDLHYNGRIIHMEEKAARYDAVTAADIQIIAQRIFSSRASVVTLGEGKKPPFSAGDIVPRPSL
ncbi:MAG: insulinase family protein [Proteobacteria bacterium]|nr:insulinase family protein [Pseudomonadota bacterium]